MVGFERILGMWRCVPCVFSRQGTDVQRCDFLLLTLARSGHQRLALGRRHAEYNGEAALRVCVPANEVSEFIELLCAIFN